MQATAKALQALPPGAKASDGAGLYWRRDAAGRCFTAWQRVGNRDLQAGRFDRPPTKADIDRARAAAAVLKAQARAEAERAAAGPVIERAPLRPVATFADVWTDLLADLKAGGKWSERNMHGNLLRVEKHLMPSLLWRMPIAAITPADLVQVLRPLRVETPDQARKIGGIVGKVFTHALGHGLIERTPTADAARLLSNTVKARSVRHFPALTDPAALQVLARAIVNMRGTPAVRHALLLQAHTCQRSGEVAGARWAELDLQAGVWTIARERMKIADPARGPQVLKLAPAVVRWLATLPRVEGCPYVFTVNGADPIAAGSLDKAMREGLGMLGRHVPHGWRAALKTNARNATDAEGRPLFADAWAEGVLDHLTGDKIADAYARGRAVEGGGRLLAWWSDLLGVL